MPIFPHLLLFSSLSQRSSMNLVSLKGICVFPNKHINNNNKSTQQILLMVSTLPQASNNSWKLTN